MSNQPVALCKLFARTGQCKYGNQCKYSHDAQNLKEQQMPMCRFFDSPLGCTKGDQCKFSHDHERANIVTQDYDKKTNQILGALGGGMSKNPNTVSKLMQNMMLE
jgi:hypothetical protein